MTDKLRWTRVPDAEAVARSACQRISKAAVDAIDARGLFRIVLAGGSTPQQTYRILAETEQNWGVWHCYFGDERCLPSDHPERNSVMAAEALTDRVPIPPQQVHRIPAELGAETAAKAYADLIDAILPFDLVLLGLGEDGHTASLFPGHVHVAKQPVVAVHNAPKLPPERVTLNTCTLGRCRQLLFLVSGGAKKEAVRKWLAGTKIPANLIEPEGTVEVLIDAAAATPI